MADSSLKPEPRKNPFWAYRDPHSGRWITLMTATQCCQLAKQVFTPRKRRSVPQETGDNSSFEQSSS
ncbi:MAG: hypothetical protein AAF773_25690 [Cyanobacteria bacterium P01_D01_bin.115]